MHFLKHDRYSDSDLYFYEIRSTKGFIIRQFTRGQKLALIPLYSRNDESSTKHDLLALRAFRCCIGSILRSIYARR